MKKYVLVLIVSMCIIFNVKAQQRFKGQWDIQASSGLTTEKGFNVQLGVEKYLGSETGAIKLSAVFARNKAETSIKDFNINYGLFTGDYFYSLEKFIPQPFYINIGLGGVLGFEEMKKVDVPAGVEQKKISNFLYGFQISPQIEYSLNSMFALYLEPKAIYFFKTDFDNLQFYNNLGIKIYLPY